MGSAGVQDSSWGRWGPISLGSSHHVNYPLFLHQITLFFHSTGYKKSSWDKLRPYGNPTPLEPKVTSCSTHRPGPELTDLTAARRGPFGSTRPGQAER